MTVLSQALCGRGDAKMAVSAMCVECDLKDIGGLIDAGVLRLIVALMDWW